MKQVIKNIGEQVIKNFFDFENNDFEVEGGFSMSLDITVGGHNLSCSVKTKRYELSYVEAAFMNDEYENIEMALNEYLTANLDASKLYSEACDYVEENYIDEYQRNGFADEADYNRYRYSA